MKLSEVDIGHVMSCTSNMTNFCISVEMFSVPWWSISLEKVKNVMRRYINLQVHYLLLLQAALSQQLVSRWGENLLNTAAALQPGLKVALCVRYWLLRRNQKKFISVLSIIFMVLVSIIFIIKTKMISTNKRIRVQEDVWHNHCLVILSINNLINILEACWGHLLVCELVHLFIIR